MPNNNYIQTLEGLIETTGRHYKQLKEIDLNLLNSKKRKYIEEERICYKTKKETFETCLTIYKAIHENK